MGIQDLTKSIKKHSPDAIKSMKPQDIEGTIYGVDVYSYLYPAKYNPSAKGKGHHIRFFFDLIVTWRQAWKQLLMVFDGDTRNVTAKMDTVAKRQEIRQQQKDIITEMTERLESGIATEKDLEDLEKATRNNIKINESDLDDLKRLFAYLHIPYYQAVGEADCLLATMYKTGKIHGVISEDSDMLTHGVGMVMRGLIDATNRTAGVVNVYNLNSILTGFKMTMSQFVDFCILSGCDYCPRIPGVGPAGAFKHIHSGGTPLTFNIDSTYEEKYREAVRMFTCHTDIQDRVAMEQNVDMDIKAWLLEHTNITEKTVDEKLRIFNDPVVPVKRKPLILAKK